MVRKTGKQEAIYTDRQIDKQKDIQTERKMATNRKTNGQ